MRKSDAMSFITILRNSHAVKTVKIFSKFAWRNKIFSGRRRRPKPFGEVLAAAVRILRFINLGRLHFNNLLDSFEQGRVHGRNNQCPARSRVFMEHGTGRFGRIGRKKQFGKTEVGFKTRNGYEATT